MIDQSVTPEVELSNNPVEDHLKRKLYFYSSSSSEEEHSEL